MMIRKMFKLIKPCSLEDLGSCYYPDVVQKMLQDSDKRELKLQLPTSQQEDAQDG